MRIIISTLLFACAFSAVAIAEEPTLTSPPEGDMSVLFNGKDLEGWDGDPRLWTVRDGVIHGETTDENRANGNTFLIWKDGKTADFELRLSVRSNATNNSGIQYRSTHITEKPRNNWVVRGYQHEIRNENKLPNVSGFIYDEGGKRGRICLLGEKAIWSVKDGGKQVQEELIDGPAYEKLFKLDDWNDVVIVAKGNHIQHYMNGQLVLDFQDDPELALLEGVLALQLHAGKPMWVEFKNIRIREL